MTDRKLKVAKRVQQKALLTNSPTWPVSERASPTTGSIYCTLSCLLTTGNRLADLLGEQAPSALPLKAQ
jgi:hypothetical protein